MRSGRADSNRPGHFYYMLGVTGLAAMIVASYELHHKALVEFDLFADIGVVVGTEHGDAAVYHAL